MKLIERYIFKKAGLATLVTLGALVGVVWIVQALKGVDIIANKGQTIFAYLALTTLVVPNLIQAVIPVALLISCIYAINTMNTNTEWISQRSIFHDRFELNDCWRKRLLYHRCLRWF